MFTVDGSRRATSEVIKLTHRDGNSFADPARHKPQYDPADRDAQPEACRGHTAGKGSAASHTHHEGDNPASQGHFHADVTEQEESTDPGDARRRQREQGISESALVFLGGLYIRLTEHGACRAPEASCAGDDLNDRACNLRFLSKRVKGRGRG